MENHSAHHSSAIQTPTGENIDEVIPFLVRVFHADATTPFLVRVFHADATTPAFVTRSKKTIFKPMSGDRYFIADQNGIYFTTFTIVDWLDVFIRDSYRVQIAEDLNYCIGHKGLEVYSWCLMSSHLHMIISAREGYRISDIIRDFKKHSAKAILEKIQTEPESRRDDLLWHFERAGKYDSRITTYKFWQEDNHAIHIDPMNTEMLQQKIEYIHNNPVKEGWVQYAHEYIYSSAKDYAGQMGLVKIKFV